MSSWWRDSCAHDEPCLLHEDKCRHGKQGAFMEVDKDRLGAFMGKMLGDFGAAANAALIKVGDRLGLYKLLAAQGPLTPQQLAQASNTSERCVREWLSAQAASGYVE